MNEIIEYLRRCKLGHVSQEGEHLIMVELDNSPLRIHVWAATHPKKEWLEGHRSRGHVAFQALCPENCYQELKKAQFRVPKPRG